MMRKRILSMILCTAMVFTSVVSPIAVQAKEGKKKASELYNFTTIYTDGTEKSLIKYNADNPTENENGGMASYEMSQDVGSKNYMLISLTTNVNLVGHIYYEKTGDSNISHSEKFYIEAGTEEFTTFLDAYRKGAAATYEKTIKKITLQNVDDTKEGKVTLHSVGFSDRTYDVSEMMYITDGTLKVGTSLEYGGAITYLSRVTSGKETVEYVEQSTYNTRIKPADEVSNSRKEIATESNLINVYDLGREVQQSFYWPVTEDNGYSPATPNVYNEDTHYNPIQCGSCKSNGPQIVDFRYSDTEIYVKIYGQDWYRENQVDDTYFETWLSFGESGVLIVKNKTTNFTQFTKTDDLEYVRQETPALYTVYPLNYFYAETKEGTINDPNLCQDGNNIKTSLSETIDGNYSYRMDSDQVMTDWIAFVTEEQYGLGIYNPSADYYSASRGKKSIKYTENTTVHKDFYEGTWYDWKQSCDTDNYSYLSTAINCKMTDFVPLEYSYAIYAGYVNEMRSAFNNLRNSGDLEVDEIAWDRQSPAADDTTVATDVEYVEYSTVKDYVDYSTYPDKYGYVFAGWYAKESEGTYRSLNKADLKDVTTAYAKFVPKDVLKVKYQISADTKADSKQTALRLLSSVDTLKYCEVGFDIGLMGQKANVSSRDVYETITGYTSAGENYYKPNDQFHTKSKYFITSIISEIPSGLFNEGFKITPYWKTKDGTKVSGTSRIIKINDSFVLEKLMDDIDKLTLKDVESKLPDLFARYDALSQADKEMVTNASKITSLRNMEVISANKLTNHDENGSDVNFTYATDATYGAYGELVHEGINWASVKYTSDMQLQGMDKDLVVYMYNPTNEDVEIAFGYLHAPNTGNIFGNQCYKYENLKAKAWTKVVIDWEVYKAEDVQIQHMLMVASTGGSCTAGNTMNMTGFKMSSMYIVDDADSLNQYVKEVDKVQELIKAIDELSFANVESVLEQYNALSDADKSKVTNADKLKPFETMTVVSADKLANHDENGSEVNFTYATDATYGAYGELVHEGINWASVKYTSDMQLQGTDKDLVVYMYNPTNEDVEIAFGYLHAPNTGNIFGNQCYKYENLKAKAWTKVVIDWEAYKAEDVQIQHMLMVASTGGDCTAGNTMNMTGFKMSSMYIVDNVASLDDLIPKSDAVKNVIKAIDELKLATYATKLENTVAQYNALSNEEKALVTNADKLTVLENMTVVSAEKLENHNENGSDVKFTYDTDATYGAYGELAHEGINWASVKYTSDMQLQGMDKDLVVYMYNPTNEDVEIAFGYLHAPNTGHIFGNQCYKYETLKAKAWTKVVINWEAYKAEDVQIQHMLMVASTGGDCTAGNTMNMTGFKMTSMYIVDDASSLDAFVK